MIPDPRQIGGGGGDGPPIPNRGWDPHLSPRSPANRGWGRGWGSGVPCPALDADSEDRVRVLINVACTLQALRVACHWPVRSPMERVHRGKAAHVSRHDRKPGRQLPGASIAGQSDRVHHRGGRREVGTIQVSQYGLLGACDSEHARYSTCALLIALWQGTMDDPAAHDARCASECPGQAAAPVAMNLKVTSMTESALKLDSGYLSLGLKINDVGAFRCQFSTCSSLRFQW